MNVSPGDFYFSQAQIEKPVENLREAKNRYEQSLSTWKAVQQSGQLLSADADKLEIVSQKLAKCEKALGNR